MFVDAYEVGPIRPPSESGSLLIRAMRNCPWNKCEFCMVYKGEKFELKPVEETLADIDRAAEFYGSRAVTMTSAFLQDANAVMIKTPDLLRIIERMKEKFPALDRITTYGRHSTLAKKSVEELRQLREAGLTRIHAGLETGYGPLLDFIRKGTTPEKQVVAGRKVKEAGISLSEYVMPGLGGREMSEGHAIETAKVLSAINPDFIRIRSTSVRPETPLYEKMKRGEFTPLSDEETVVELRLMIDNLTGICSEVASDHILNLLQEVEGRLPEDKEKMLATIDEFLGLPAEEKTLFQIGARLGIFRGLRDMKAPAARARAEHTMRMIRQEVRKRGGGFTVEDFIQEALRGVM